MCLVIIYAAVYLFEGQWNKRSHKTWKPTLKPNACMRVKKRCPAYSGAPL